MELSLGSKIAGGITVLEVRGEADVYSSPTLRDRLMDLLDTGSPDAVAPVVVVDLSEVGFIDSTGLGTLVAAHKRAADQNGALPVVCAQDRILKLLRITGLDDVFEIHATLDEALASARRAR